VIIDASQDFSGAHRRNRSLPLKIAKACYVWFKTNYATDNLQVFFDSKEFHKICVEFGSLVIFPTLVV